MKTYSFIYSFKNSSVALATEDYGIIKGNNRVWYSAVLYIPFRDLYIDVNMA